MADEPKVEPKIELTKEELQSLINIVSQVNVPVKDSQNFVALINKMSKMMDQVKQSRI